MKLADTLILVSHAFGSIEHGADHSLRVADNLEDPEPDLYNVGLLHDIVEDTNVCLGYLEELGYPPEVLEAVDLLTHDKKQLDYPAYIDRICESGNRWAILVKLADQKDNLDPARWLLLGKYKARALTKRYAGVVPKLEEALENAAA
jgi:(p)ppGpp synthase/HD superfamily hydrolase